MNKASVKNMTDLVKKNIFLSFKAGIDTQKRINTHSSKQFRLSLNVRVVTKKRLLQFFLKLVY